VFANSFKVEVWAAAGDNYFPFVDTDFDGVDHRAMHRRIDMIRRAALDMHGAVGKVSASTASNPRWHSRCQTIYPTHPVIINDDDLSIAMRNQDCEYENASAVGAVYDQSCPR
jgi:hypothetical protein